MQRWKKPALWAIAVLLLLMAFVAFILPGIVKTQAIKGIETATGRKTAISGVSLNPLTWTARVHGFRLMEKKEDAVFASFSSVRLSINPLSILHFAPVVSKVQLVSPYIHIVRTAANSYNFSDLMEGKKKKSGKPPRFSINNITVENGSVDFIDRAIPREKTHTLRNIQVGVPFISNIKYLADRYVQPRFSAVVNGSQFKMEGKLRPYLEGAEAVYNLNLNGLSIPYYLAYYPGEPPAKVESGRLSTALEIIHRLRKGKEPELEIKGKVVLDDIAAREKNGAPLFSLARGEAKIDRAEVFSREFNLGALIFDTPVVHLDREKDGVWNLQHIARGKEVPGEKPEVEKKAEQKPSGKKPTINVSETRISNGSITVNDSLPPGGFKGEIGELAFVMHGFSTVPGRKGNFDLTFATPRKESGEVRGEFSVDPLTVATTADLKEIDLEAYYPYLAAQITSPVKGRLDLSAGMSLTPADGARLTKLDIELRRLEASFGKKDGVKLEKLVVSGGKASLKEKSAEVGDIQLSNADIRLSRDEKGALSPMALLVQGKRGEKKEVTAAGEKKDGGEPFKVTLARVGGSGIDIAFTDRMKEEAPVMRVRKLRFDLKNITTPRFSPIPFDIAAGYGKKGSISARGSVEPKPLKVKGECTLKSIPITDATPYLPEDVNITLADGYLDTKLAFNIAQKGKELAGSFSGAMAVRSLDILDADDEELLKWESLQLDNIKGGLAPFSLNIADVSLSRFYSRIVVSKEGVLNLQQIRSKEEPQTSGGKEAAPPAAPVKETPSPAPAPQQQPAKKGLIKVGSVTLQNGTVSFTDHQTRPEYSSKMVNLGGRISGLSSDVNTTAEVDLRGNLENHSPLRITGRINPLREDLFVDLKVSFTDIELSPFTPYAGTYLGYSVDKGKLFLDLNYHIEKKSLDSSHKLFIDQFTFGKKVESDKATSLPVRLAVALLKDRKGEIHLDIPVTGRTDDPKFSIWGVVWKILKNLLVKAATSPFALLQSLFGGKEDFSNVAFAYGSARISDAEKSKLAKLSQALADRPGLKVEVSGFVDPERDPEGYRNELLLKKMKNEKFVKLVKEKKGKEGETADSVEILPQEYHDYLKAVYKKEKFPKPRNFIGLLKDLPDEEMKKLFLTHTVVGATELQNLARERGVAVRNFLITEGKLPAERIFEKKGDITKAPAKEGDNAARVEFGAATD